MSRHAPKEPPLTGLLGEALLAEGEERKAKTENAAAGLLAEMELKATRVRELILAQPPNGLLGYLWSRFFIGALDHHKKNGGDGGPDSTLLKRFQFVLEYLHAVWSSHKGDFIEAEVDEDKANELLVECDRLSDTAIYYSMASSQLPKRNEFGDASPNIEFQAKSTWILIRGHRYQVLEEEFFNFALAPHKEAIEAAYGVTSAEVAVVACTRFC